MRKFLVFVIKTGLRYTFETYLYATDDPLITTHLTDQHRTTILDEKLYKIISSMGLRMRFGKEHELTGEFILTRIYL